MEAANTPSSHRRALQRSRVRFDMAEHRGAFWKAYSIGSRFKGLGSSFLPIPTPRRDIANYSRSIVAYRDMLNRERR